MISDVQSDILPEMSMQSMLNNEDLSELIRMQRQQHQAARERERELDIYRSGSAPPTVEGSLNSIGGLVGNNEFVGIRNNDKGGFFNEDLMRSDPAYIDYYYTDANSNPRMPPPLLSKEDWKSAHRVHGGSVVGDNRMGLSRGGRDKEVSGSLFSVQPGFGGGNDENGNGKEGVDWGGDGLIGLQSFGGLPSRQKSIAESFQDDIGHANSVSRHDSRPASRNAFDNDIEATEDQFLKLHASVGSSASQSYASALSGSLSRRQISHNTQFGGRSPSPIVQPIGGSQGISIGKRDLSDLNSFNGFSSSLSESAELVSALSGLGLSTNGQVRGGSPYLQNGNNNSLSFQNGLKGYALNPSSPPMVRSQLGSANLPPLFDNAAVHSVLGGNRLDSGSLGGLGPNSMDSLYSQYIRSNEYAAMRLAALNNPSNFGEYLGNSYVDLMQQAYLGSLLSQRSPYGAPKNHNYHVNPAFGLDTSYSGSTMRHSERAMQFASGMRNLEETFASSLLDEFKSNKTKCFELSDIADHVVEFSSDQYGSRFIQQKLETATTAEKDMVFNEIMPHGLTLMTDVFGNYVIQKFLEHGSPSQIRELANQLIGHVLTLSLQMYGCRVIQKAIEVVELDQKQAMVKELDGHIMRCVRDQNGNHVIQKCIECVPEDCIQYIVSTFYDQVVILSTHPYGCRVIQRVLEHCHSARTQQIMMDEILQNVCMLTQDQYGNYVVQHVLEHGKPHERTEIIQKLTGQIVKMSQQKFASNVIEKCLTFGTAKEREELVNEMLGTTDENEPLQVMMKDQFANYVVQKVLETCDDQQLELILNRIKTHLTTLKKYTYGKHIVARVEKLVAAGERRISILTQTV